MNWYPLLAQAAAWLAALGVTGTACAAAAFALFRWFGASWLEAKFAKDLEEFKAEKNSQLSKLNSGYQQEAERLKADVNRLLDRATKLHAREYEILPAAWGLLSKAHGATASLESSIQVRPDLDAMRPEQLDEFLQRSELSEWQKLDIAKSTEKGATYARHLVWLQIGQASSAIIEYQNYTILNGVFMEDEVAAKFSEASQELRLALIYRENIASGFAGNEMWQLANKSIDRVDKLTSEIKVYIRNKMFDTRLPLTI